MKKYIVLLFLFIAVSVSARINLLDTRLITVSGEHLSIGYSQEDYAFYSISGSPDRTSGQPMTTTLSEGRPIDMDSGELAGEDVATVSADGLLTYGAYTNIYTYSEDLTDSDWSKANVTIENLNDAVFNSITDARFTQFFTSAATTITVSLLCSIEDIGKSISFGIWDDTLAGLNTGRSPDIEIIAVEGKGFAEYTWTGLSNPDTLSCINDVNDPIQTIHDCQLQFTESPYRLPYVKTEASAVSVPLNYSDADEGYKWQITPDDIGSLYTGDLGIDLIINGDFDTDTDWDKDGGWSILNGKAVATASTGRLTQESVLTPGRCYEAIFTVSDYVGGTARPAFGDNTGSFISANGTYIERMFVTSGTSFEIDGGVAFTGKIDNIIVKEVSRNMGMPLLLDALDGAADGTDLKKDTADSLGIGWSDTGTYEWSCDGSQVGLTNLQFNNIFTLTNRYEIKVVATNITAGAYRIYKGGAYSEYAGGNGEFTVRGTQDEVNMYIQGDVDFIGTVTITHVKEISHAEGEMQVEWTPMFDYDEMSTDDIGNVLTSSTNTLDLIRFRDSAGVLYWQVYEGTNLINLSGVTFAVGIKHTLKVLWGTHPVDGADKMQIIITDSTTTWESTVESFDGSFDPGDFFSLAWENEYPQFLKSVKVYGEPKSW